MSRRTCQEKISYKCIKKKLLREIYEIIVVFVTKNEIVLEEKFDLTCHILKIMFSK